MPVVSTPITNFPLKRPARASALSQLNGSGNMGAIVARAARHASHFSRWIFGGSERGGVRRSELDSAFDGGAAIRRARPSRRRSYSFQPSGSSGPPLI
jgi:hypothetical protein